MKTNSEWITKEKKILAEIRKREETHTPDALLVIKAMKAIEGLTFDDIGGSPREKLENIYKLAHASLGYCPNHPDWVKDIDRCYKAMVCFGVANK